MGKIHIYLFSPVPVIIEGIKNAIKSSKIAFSFSSDNFESILKRVRKAPPGVILLDDSCQEPDSINEFLVVLKEYHPDIRTLVYTDKEDSKYLISLLNAGIKGLLHKRAPIDKIFEAFMMLSQKKIFLDNIFSYKISQAVISENIEKEKMETMISKKEKEILRLISKGLKNNEIARSLFISSGTVQVHKTNILKKLKFKTTAELAVFAAKFSQLK